MTEFDLRLRCLELASEANGNVNQLVTTLAMSKRFYEYVRRNELPVHLETGRLTAEMPVDLSNGNLHDPSLDVPACQVPKRDMAQKGSALLRRLSIRNRY